MANNTCPHCGHGKVRCVNSREPLTADIMRRRTYECPSCKGRFTTEETIVQIEGRDIVITPRHRAVLFVEEVDALVRKHFGTDGRMYGARGTMHGMTGTANRSVADED